MKFEKNRRYFTISFFAFGVIAASMILFFILLYPSKLIGGIAKIISILAPLIVGFLIAFILNPLLKLFEEKIFAKVLNAPKQKNLKRALSIVCTYVIFLGIITLFIVLIIPSLIASINDLINNIQDYYTKGIALATEFLSKYNISTEILAPFTNIGEELVTFTIDAMNSILPKLYGVATSAASILKNTVVGFAFSIYMLASKEVFKNQALMLLAIFTKPKTKDRILRVFRLSNETFSKYISGYMTDSAIVGLVCYFVMLIFGWPYPALISILIGITNMIPFFGPFIGAVPSAFLILLVNPWEALFFVIFIVILQQIDGNFICPKILGQRVGLSSFWVMVAIVVGGSVFGIAGMLLGVPTFAVIYSLMRTYLARRLKTKKKKDNAGSEADGENV